MFDFYVPANWFWILVALLVTFYVKLACDRNLSTPAPVAPASIFSLF